MSIVKHDWLDRQLLSYSGHNTEQSIDTDTHGWHQDPSLYRGLPTSLKVLTFSSGRLKALKNGKELQSLMCWKSPPI